MGKIIVDRDGDKITVVLGARKARNRKFEGKFLIRNMTYRKAQERLQQMFRPITGMYEGWGR